MCLFAVTGGIAFCSVLVQSTPDLDTIDPIAVINFLVIKAVMMLTGAYTQGLRISACLAAPEVTKPRLILHLSSPVLTVSELLNIPYIQSNLLTLITAEPFVSRQASATSIPCNSTVAYSMNAVANYMERWIDFTG